MIIETHVIFDTMLYRKIGAMLKYASEEQKTAFKSAFFAAEKPFSIQPKLSVLVVLELLKHLKNKNDMAYGICKEGLLFALDHTEEGILQPPESHFAALFFEIKDTNSDFSSKLLSVLNKIKESKGHDEPIPQLTSEIKGLTGKFFDMIDTNIFVKKAEMVKSVSKKVKKLSLHAPLHEKEQAYKQQAHAFLTHLRTVYKIESTENQELQIQYLIQNHRAAFEKLRILALKIQNNDMPLHKQSNDIADALILMGLSPAENTVLVTAEKANIAIINKVGLKDWVISQEDYFKKVGIEGIKKASF